MRFFQNLSIRRKQTLIIMLTSAITLVMACAAFVGFEAYNFRGDLVDEISTMAQIAGNNCTAALDFNDPKAAEDTIGALRVEPPISGACIYNREGDIFAVYHRDDKSRAAGFLPVQVPGYEFRGNQLRIFLPIMVQGDKVGTICVVSDLYEFGNRLKHLAWTAMLVLGISLLAAFFLSIPLQRVISGPLLQLAQAVRSVAVEKNYSVRAAKQNNDELGQLVDGFNEMLAQIQARDTALETARDHLEKRVEERTRELEVIHKQLLEASRLGGMAEIATNVLHNVGNVLNSVNISTSMIVENVKKSRASRLADVVLLLQEHAHDLGEFITNDSRGKRLPTYLAQLSDHLIAGQKAMVTELDSLQQNVGHIKEIVAMQQNYAMVGGLKEMVSIVDLVEDSMRMNEGALKRHRVEVTREYKNSPFMNVEKHKILQILVNLVRNAKYACDESDRPDRRLTMRVAGKDGRVRISVIDNGIGIPPENLSRIFNHGFTTRKDGHGFGLHSGALSAKEMGGSLTVSSDGIGKGADFTLELPCPDTGELT